MRASLAVLVLLLAMLAAQASPAVALTPSLPSPLAAPEEEAESSEGEEGEGGEDVEAEEEEEEAEGGPGPPGECVLQTARARAVASTTRNVVRLTMRYTALASTDVGIELRASGKGGSLLLARAWRQMSERGVFRLSESFGGAKMAKVRAAGSLTVTVHVPISPSYCERYYSRHLTIKRTAKRRLAWLQSDSVFGT